MDIDLFFSTPRWKILEIISRKGSSPIEIAEKIGTSVAYVSQQLKLLEAANLVTKKRTGSAEKGKPRMVYSLSREVSQLTVLINHSPVRKVIELTDHHKLILRIWSLEDQRLHYYLEKFLWLVESEIQDLDGIFVDTSSIKTKILIVSTSKKIKPKCDTYIKEIGGLLDCEIVTESQILTNSLENIHPIYDPKFIVLGNNLKGGILSE